ncbi:MAG: UPF0280 family protein [Syntrophaceae bacterium]|nr:UPF0280 family protein [Syntrophaceae bacterium]
MNCSPNIVVAEPRIYRSFANDDVFTNFRVVVDTSDLYIKALSNLADQAKAFVMECRAQIEDSIARRLQFLTSFDPIDTDPLDSSAPTRMINAAEKAGVGPMAAVAGAVAEFVGRNLLQLSREIIVENGGDIFVHVNRPVVIGIHAGTSPLSDKLGIKIGPTTMPLGICTSSAKVGPSTSLGKADAATVVSYDVSLADAVATGLGNRIKSARDMKSAVEWAMSVDGVLAALVIFEDKLAVSGDIELTPVDHADGLQASA